MSAPRLVPVVRGGRHPRCRPYADIAEGVNGGRAHAGRGAPKENTHGAGRPALRQVRPPGAGEPISGSEPSCGLDLEPRGHQSRSRRAHLADRHKDHRLAGLALPLCCPPGPGVELRIVVELENHLGAPRNPGGKGRMVHNTSVELDPKNCVPPLMDIHLYLPAREGNGGGDQAP